MADAVDHKASFVVKRDGELVPQLRGVETIASMRNESARREEQSKSSSLMPPGHEAEDSLELEHFMDNVKGGEGNGHGTGGRSDGGGGGGGGGRGGGGGGGGGRGGGGR
ncbi:hypothetical protein H6P81_018749 [Aristolochia fimbriata]|uniref:Uncharacterized protein n=1 Tax=Aristolochia fimbriata TaxID=158543 RepID=A0AAV7E1X5_ARIFI|nr:hypothetical protein H6P81_018749 [Aristolochia fimbriata]